MFGCNAVRLDIGLPIWGLHVETVARAVQIVRSLHTVVHGLKVVLNQIQVAAAHRILGHTPDFSNAHSLLNTGVEKKQYEDAAAELESLKLQHVDIWDALSTKVYSLHRTPTVIRSMYGINH